MTTARKELKMKPITLEGIMALRPCADYPRERIAKLMGERKAVTARQILGARSIPEKDRLWLVLHEELLPATLLRELACDFAQAAIDHYGNGDERSQVAVDLALGYAVGIVEDETLAAAGAAAWDAAQGAAQGAARAAAWAAAQAAVWDASLAADRAAAAYAAAAGQLAHVRAVLKKAGVK